MIKKIIKEFKRILKEEDGYWGKYKGSDKKAKADEKLWGAVERGFGLIEEGYQFTMQDVGERREFARERTALGFTGLQDQFGGEALGQNIGFRDKQNKNITQMDELTNQMMNRRTIDAYSMGADNLQLERAEKEQAFKAEEFGAGLDRKNAIYQAYLDYEKNRTNLKHDAKGGFNIDDILGGEFSSLYGDAFAGPIEYGSTDPYEREEGRL